MATYLHQCFPAIFTDSFIPQSLNHDPDMFYSVSTSLSPSSFLLTYLHDGGKKTQRCIGVPSGENH